MCPYLCVCVCVFRNKKDSKRVCLGFLSSIVVYSANRETKINCFPPVQAPRIEHNERIARANDNKHHRQKFTPITYVIVLCPGPLHRVSGIFDFLFFLLTHPNPERRSGRNPSSYIFGNRTVILTVEEEPHNSKRIVLRVVRRSKSEIHTTRI